jgi:hypothetical protein
VCLAHPWVVTAAGRQALLGPNVMRHAEQWLEATAALGLDPAKRLAIWRAVDSYTMGHAQISPGRDQSDGHPAPDPGWRAAAEAYPQDPANSGNFPTSPPSAPSACCTTTTTSSPSRPASAGSSPASPPTPNQPPRAAAPADRSCRRQLRLLFTRDM